MIEICFLQFLAGPNAPLRVPHALDAGQREERRQAVKEIGAKSLVISSDLGQQGNMTHPDGLENAIAAMKALLEGISDGDIDLMMRKNPARYCSGEAAALASCCGSVVAQPVRPAATRASTANDRLLIIGLSPFFHARKW
jgi:hypothetical protein